MKGVKGEPLEGETGRSLFYFGEPGRAVGGGETRGSSGGDLQNAISHTAATTNNGVARGASGGHGPPNVPKNL
jgi:hypothetical protein